MSGGEKARLLLALTLHARPQLLVLDEPTNHLDAQARDALADALAEFDGALLLVSHDRYLLRSTVDAFVLVANGRVEAFDGDLDDYANWLLQRPASRGGDDGANADAQSASRRDDRRNAARRRAALAERLRPFDEEIAAIERQLDDIGARIAPIDARLADPDAYRDAADAARLARERTALQRERETLEERWIERSTARDVEREAFERDDSPADGTA